MCKAQLHVHVALRNQKEKKGEVTYPTIAQTNIHVYTVARDTWMPSLENWGGGLHVHVAFNSVPSFLPSFTAPRHIAGLPGIHGLLPLQTGRLHQDRREV